MHIWHSSWPAPNLKPGHKRGQFSLCVTLALAKEGLSKWKTYRRTLATGSVCGIAAHTWHWALERLSKGPRVWVACASALITLGRSLCRCQTRLWSWKFHPFLAGSSGPPAPLPLHRRHFLPDFFCVLALKKIKCTYHMLTLNAFKGPTQHCWFSMTLPSTAKIKPNSSLWYPSECSNHPFGTGSLSPTDVGFCSHAWIVIHAQS